MIHIPKRKKGKQSTVAQAVYEIEMLAFFEAIKKIAATLPFKVSSRGWCYILEDHGLTKGSFKSAVDKFLDYGAIEQRQGDISEQQSQVSLLVRQLMKAA